MENISITYNDDTITEKYSSINNNTGEWEEDSYAICHYLNNDGYLFRSENVENGEVSMSTIYKYSGNQLKMSHIMIRMELNSCPMNTNGRMEILSENTNVNGGMEILSEKMTMRFSILAMRIK